MERVSYHVADFFHTHLRGLRVLWNGLVMRSVVLLIMARRTRVFGEEHVKGEQEYVKGPAPLLPNLLLI